jgi:hypothetical protein
LPKNGPSATGWIGSTLTFFILIAPLIYALIKFCECDPRQLFNFNSLEPDLNIRLKSRGRVQPAISDAHASDGIAFNLRHADFEAFTFWIRAKREARTEIPLVRSIRFHGERVGLAGR